MKLEKAITHALDGNALLFLGSGASFGATPIEGDHFLTGRELAIKLGSISGMTPPTDDLNYASQHYRRKKSDASLVDLLKNYFTASSVSEFHKGLSEIDWLGIYTTNYDDVIEKAFSESGKKLTPITPNQDSRNYTKLGNHILHINGYVDHLTSNELNDSFKLTNTSYLTESFSKSNWSFIFRRQIDIARAIIFVGYSMYDLDIQRILYGSDDFKNKTIFIEKPGLTDEEMESSLQYDFGEIFPIGLRGFVEKLEDIRSDYEPQDTSDAYFSFTRHEIALSSLNVRDDDFFRLVLQGDVIREAVCDSVNQGKELGYYIYRDVIDKARPQSLDSPKAFLLTANLGNGKTMICQALLCRFSANGYSCFSLNDDADSATQEVEAICGIKERVFLVVENYPRFLDIVKHIQMVKPASLTLCLTARTTHHEAYQDDLVEIFQEEEIVEYNVDELSEQELHCAARLLDGYKLWGARDGWPERRKISYLKKQCGSELGQILLDVIKSPLIQEKFKSIFESFKYNSKLTDVIIAASTLKLLGIDRPKKAMISELLDSDYMYSLDFKSNELARSVFSSMEGSIVPRSSIVAKYGLNYLIDAKYLITRLIDIAKNAHDKGASSQAYWNIYKDLVTFSVLQPMLPEKGRRDALILFYEGLKNLRGAKKNPHFWLQYAIARLASDRPSDINMAKVFLDSAYSEAKKRRNYHTRHLDNVLARYYVQHAISCESDASLAMLEVVDCHKILVRQCNAEKVDSPYRVARNYLTFYYAKGGQLSEGQIDMLQSMAKTILLFVSNLPSASQEHSTVRFCKSELEELVKQIDGITTT